MSEKENEKEESNEDSSEEKDAVNNTSASEKAGTSKETTQTTITDAKEIISDSSDFKLPLLAEYLGNKDSREGILNSARIVEGKYGKTAILDLEEC